MDNILYLQKMKQFFIRRGKKNVLEKLFQTFLLNHAVTTKDTVNNLLRESTLNSVPYIKLRSRRKGARVMHKISFLEKEESMRKGLLAFAKKLQDTKSGNFLRALEQELNNLSLGKSVIMTKRDELHATALDAVPHTWGIKSISDNKKK